MQPVAVDPDAHHVARLALARYPITVRSMRLLSRDFNTTYRVDAVEGRFVIRVGRPGWRDPVDIVSTAAWMRALAREADLLIPEVVRTRDGEDLASVPGRDDVERHCVLETWVGGPIVGERCSTRFMRQLGDLTARMHDHADGFVAPAGFSTRRLETSWSGGPDRAVVTPRAPLALPAALGALVSAARVVVDRALADLEASDPEGRRFLHVDLHRWNLKYAGGRIAVIDFDDSAWAYPQQDIGIAFYHVIDRPDHPALWEAFEVGYSARRVWPERVPGEIRRLVIARALDLLGFVLGGDEILSGDELAAWLGKMERRLEGLLGGEG